jgi:hypothetical protein
MAYLSSALLFFAGTPRSAQSGAARGSGRSQTTGRELVEEEAMDGARAMEGKGRGSWRGGSEDGRVGGGGVRPWPCSPG